MMCHSITQQLTKKETDILGLNSTHENLIKVTATFQNACKQYFSLKLRKHTKKLNDIFESSTKNFGTQVLFQGWMETGSAGFLDLTCHLERHFTNNHNKLSTKSGAKFHWKSFNFTFTVVFMHSKITLRTGKAKTRV